MELTIFLSKVLGIALIVVGAAVLVRRRYFIPVFGAFVEERLLRAFVSIIELLAGLALVVGHDTWTPLPAAIISLLGWMVVVEATMYLVLPDDLVEKVIRALNIPVWYVLGGLLAIGIGLFLTGFGFGWW